MVAIPFPAGSNPGHVNHAESQGRLINCFAEPLVEGKSLKHVRVPGMTEFATSSESTFRGMFLVDDTLFIAFDGELMRTTSAGGAMTSHDTFAAGTTSVYFARDNASPPNVYMVSEDGAFRITEGPNDILAYSGGVGPNWQDGILPQPNSCFSLGGYVFFTVGAGTVYATDLNSPDMEALSNALIETKPDTLIRGVAFGGRALLFGSQSLEIWTDVGASPFPLQRATSIPFGLMGPDAVAGWEDGFGSGLLWVADDGSVRQLDGYQATKVSTPDLERLIARDGSLSTLLASVHVVDGHPMWTITGEDFTWEYDLGIKKWHERMSWRELRIPAIPADPYDYHTQRWRGLQTVRAFDKWLVGDRNTSNVFEIDPTNHTEDDEPLRMRIESGPVGQFPARVRVARADFHFETGVGIDDGAEPIQTDPSVQISWTDDGGTYWSNPLIRPLGRESIYRNISVFNTGLSTRHGRRWRLDISDPVYVSLLGGDQSTEMRRG